MSQPFRLPVAATAEVGVYQKHLEAKRQAVHDMLDGLRRWLTLDLDAELERLKMPLNPGPVMLYRPSIEELTKACENVDFYQRQWDAIQENLLKVPEDFRPVMSMALPMLEGQLRDAIKYRDQLQSALEAAESQEPEA